MEFKTLTLDFAKKLPVGDRLQDAALVSVDDPALRLGTPVLNDSTVAVQVGGGVVGHDYILSAQVLTEGGDTLVERVRVEVRDDANH